MKLEVLALGYQVGGVLDPEVRDAVAEARSRGVAGLLVTGRILADPLLFDSIVAVFTSAFARVVNR